jgi:hypothetical protein
MNLERLMFWSPSIILLLAIVFFSCIAEKEKQIIANPPQKIIEIGGCNSNGWCGVKTAEDYGVAHFPVVGREVCYKSGTDFLYCHDNK